MSTQRRCDFVKATTGQWFVTLGKFEHAHRDQDCEVYGPFDSFESAHDFVFNTFSNPGGYCSDETGTKPVPANAIEPVDTDYINGDPAALFKNMQYRL